jgi:hypothetical protein
MDGKMLLAFVSDHYYQACLAKLIPALNDHGVTMDDDLLSATVILPKQKGQTLLCDSNDELTWPILH